MYDIERDGDLAVLTATRRFEGMSRTVGRRQLDDLLRDGVRRVVLDLSELRSIDSMGVGQVVVAFQRVREAGGSLVLAGLQPAVQRVFAVTLIEQIMPSFEDREAARAALVRGRPGDDPGDLR